VIDSAVQQHQGDDRLAVAIKPVGIMKSVERLAFSNSAQRLSSVKETQVHFYLGRPDPGCHEHLASGQATCILLNWQNLVPLYGQSFRSSCNTPSLSVEHWCQSSSLLGKPLSRACGLPPLERSFWYDRLRTRVAQRRAVFQSLLHKHKCNFLLSGAEPSPGSMVPPASPTIPSLVRASAS
jgi:hypothetical protein